MTDTADVLRHWGRNLMSAREQAGLTPTDLGRAVDTSPRTITQIEDGSREPSLDLRLRLSGALDLDGGVLWSFPPRLSLDALLFHA